MHLFAARVSRTGPLTAPLTSGVVISKATIRKPSSSLRSTRPLTTSTVSSTSDVLTAW
jgi:hypothetical protein